jgi:cation transport ATPase
LTKGEFHFSTDGFWWVQFVLATPVVLWAGWPFFERSIEQQVENGAFL